jgi:hypothetical protein
MVEVVRPTPRFERDIERLKVDYPRINEVRSALMRELARNPFVGEPHYSPDIRIFLTTPVGVMPVFRVLYKLTGDKRPVVVLLSIDSSSPNSNIPL